MESGEHGISGGGTVSSGSDKRIATLTSQGARLSPEWESRRRARQIETLVGQDVVDQFRIAVAPFLALSQNLEMQVKYLTNEILKRRVRDSPLFFVHDLPSAGLASDLAFAVSLWMPSEVMSIKAIVVCSDGVRLIKQNKFIQELTVDFWADVTLRIQAAWKVRNHLTHGTLCILDEQTLQPLDVPYILNKGESWPINEETVASWMPLIIELMPSLEISFCSGANWPGLKYYAHDCEPNDTGHCAYMIFSTGATHVREPEVSTFLGVRVQTEGYRERVYNMWRR